MSALRILRGLRERDRSAAGALYWQAFGGKLGRVLGPEARAARFICRGMDPAHAFCALDEAGQLVGVIGFRTREGSFVDGAGADLRAVYGRAGGAWRQLCLSVLGHDLEPRALLVDGICVAPHARSQGVGTALIEALCAEARRRGFDQIRLDVAGPNRRARALYERLGFRQVRVRWNPLTGLLFGFCRARVMIRAL